jgi:NOL1/NOP2/fmu family ribosome biogenesis protein
MRQLKILNKKEVKEILKLFKEQWQADADLDYVFLKNNDNDIFIAGREVFDTDFEKLKVNSLGLYFGELKKGSLRLSIEGSQIIGLWARKNVVELDDGEAKLWLRGFDLEKETKAQGYVLLRHKGCFMGTGRAKEGKILNFVPKTRRIRSVD